MRRWLPLLVFGWLLGAAAPTAATPLVVVDSTGAADGTVTLRPALVVVTPDAPRARVVLTNGSPDSSVAATLRSAPVGDAPADVAVVRLQPGEAATVTLDPVAPGIHRIVADLGTEETLEVFVAAGDQWPEVQVDRTGDAVALRASAPTVVSVQVRQRSWLGGVTAHAAEEAVLVDEPATVPVGRRSALPGPAWTDVLVVGPDGAEVRATFREGDVGRDAMWAVALLVATGGLWLVVRRSAQAAAD